MVMQPSPMAETSRPLVPRVRFCIVELLAWCPRVGKRSCADARPGGSGHRGRLGVSSFSGAVILRIGDVLQPGCGRRRIVAEFEHGEMLHEIVWSGAVPVLLAGWRVDGSS